MTYKERQEQTARLHAAWAQGDVLGVVLAGYCRIVGEDWTVEQRNGWWMGRYRGQWAGAAWTVRELAVNAIVRGDYRLDKSVVGVWSDDGYGVPVQPGGI